MAGGLTACSDGGGDAPDRAGPACAALMTRLPATVLDQPRLPDDRDASADGSDSGTGATGSAAWGGPDTDQITLTCGYPAEDPTSDQCLSVDDVDWVLAAGDAILFRSYGTNPSVHVTVPASFGRENATGALVDLADAVSRMPPSGRACIG